VVLQKRNITTGFSCCFERQGKARQGSTATATRFVEFQNLQQNLEMSSSIGFFDRGAVETDEISIIWARLNARRIKQIDVISFSWTSYNARSHLSWSCSHWNSSKEKVVSLVEEYFALDDVMSMALDLHTLGSPNYHHYFVKKLVSMALDCHDWEKEMASMLLFALYVDVIEPDQITKGFRNLLESVDDLSLDIPDAIDFFAAFLAQAVVDDIPCGIPHKDEKSPGRRLSGSCHHAASREELSAGTASCRSCELQMGQ
jgi:hypothetical protein